MKPVVRSRTCVFWSANNKEVQQPCGEGGGLILRIGVIFLGFEESHYFAHLRVLQLVIHVMTFSYFSQGREGVWQLSP